jgi:iron(III) transport system ATP-binding protein
MALSCMRATPIIGARMMRDTPRMGLRIFDVTHRYGAVAAVSAATFDVAPGEIVCLYGPSGCGKTTLLRLVAGLERLQDGEIVLDGAALSSRAIHTPPERRPVGIVFQDYALFPHMTVAENIAFGLVDLPPPDRAPRVKEELAAVEMSDFAARYPASLSGGQQQRVALARALARRPRALLLDEPFASIDSALRARLRAELRRTLKARAAPALIVTHDPEEALDIADRIVVMAKGRVLEAASPEELWRAPKTAAGAAMFPRSQIILATAGANGYDTSFGPVDTPADLARFPRAVIVIRAGGAIAVEDISGAASVAECRFDPDGARALLSPAGGGEPPLRAATMQPIPVGARARLRVNWALASVFAAD